MYQDVGSRGIGIAEEGFNDLAVGEIAQVDDEILHVGHRGLPLAREALVLRDDAAVERDDRVAGEDHFGRGLVHPRAGEQVGAAEARALARDERAAVVGLRDELVAGREVEDDLRAAERERLRGLDGRAVPAPSPLAQTRPAPAGTSAPPIRTEPSGSSCAGRNQRFSWNSR